MTSPDPLPIFDDASVLQERSKRALEAALPLDEYLFRDERTLDYGVDGSIELRANGRATNIRAQVQLKGRSNTVVGADGAVSVSVETANLGYLLNGIAPIYILFRPETNELRFAYARQEWSRLERKNPKWREQKTVTIHFRRVLDAGTLAEIRDFIAAETRLRRTVDERLNSMQTSAGRVIVDAKSLEVTDSEQALQALSKFGQALVNSGQAKKVLELARTIPSSALIAMPAAALVVAYAHFHLAQYHDASAALRQLLLTAPSLSAGSTSLLDALFISVRRMLGEFDDDQYRNNMSSWARTAPPELVVQHEIAEAWSAYLRALTVTSTLESAMARTALNAALERGRQVDSPDLDRIALLELTLREHEVEDSLLNATALRDLSGRGLADADGARIAEREAHDSASRWFAELTALAERTGKTSPSLHCEVQLLRVHAVLAQAGRRELMARTGVGPSLPQARSDAVFSAVNETLELARSLENRELEVRAMQNLARALDIFGRTDEANTVAADALKIAELSGYPIERRQLASFLAGGDRFGDRLRQLLDFESASEEEQIRNAGDDQLHFMATMILEGKGLPGGRLPNVIHALELRRQLAIERRDWCRHIAHAEYQSSPASPHTMFSEPPIAKVICSLLHHEALVKSDVPAEITKEFRSRFCDGCARRIPDSGNGQNGRAPKKSRNRAKAERRRRRGKTS
jgi:tetratricopeptide (TPR) repeat protein